MDQYGLYKLFALQASIWKDLKVFFLGWMISGKWTSYPKKENWHYYEELLERAKTYANNRWKIKLDPRLKLLSYEKCVQLCKYGAGYIGMTFKNSIMINPNFSYGKKEPINETILHELAHQISFKVHGDPFKNPAKDKFDRTELLHGIEFQDIAEDLYNKFIFLGGREYRYYKDLEGIGPKFVFDNDSKYYFTKYLINLVKTKPKNILKDAELILFFNNPYYFYHNIMLKEFDGIYSVNWLLANYMDFNTSESLGIKFKYFYSEDVGPLWYITDEKDADKYYRNALDRLMGSRVPRGILN